MNSTRWKWIFFFVTTLLFLLSLRAYYVGFFNDDAFHIIGSHALLEGRYAELNQPTEPPLVHYQPGYPLLLAPISFFKPASFVPYQLLSVFLTVLGLFFAWRFFFDVVPIRPFVALILLAGLNPLTVSLSGTVLSDVPTFTVTFLFLVLARRWWYADHPFIWVGLGALGAFAFYLRPVGGALPLALVVCLLWEKRWKEAALCAVATALVVSPYILRNRFVRGESLTLGSEYLSSYQHESPLKELASFIVRNLQYYFNEFFVRLLYRWPALSLLSIVGGVFLFAVGFFTFGTKNWKKLPVVFMAVYALVHLFWSRQSGRYLLPVLPLLYAFFFLGADVVDKKFKLKGKGLGFLLIVSLILTAIPLKNILQASLTKSTPLNTPPQSTFAWIRSNTPSDAVFAAEIDGRLYLHTSRRVLHFVSGQPEEEYHQWIKAHRIDYVLVFPNTMDIGTQNKTARYRPVPVSTLVGYMKNKDDYELVFSNQGEGALIYRILNAK